MYYSLTLLQQRICCVINALQSSVSNEILVEKKRRKQSLFRRNDIITQTNNWVSNMSCRRHLYLYAILFYQYFVPTGLKTQVSVPPINRWAIHIYPYETKCKFTKIWECTCNDLYTVILSNFLMYLQPFIRVGFYFTVIVYNHVIPSGFFSRNQRPH